MFRLNILPLHLYFLGCGAIQKKVEKNKTKQYTITWGTRKQEKERKSKRRVHDKNLKFAGWKCKLGDFFEHQKQGFLESSCLNPAHFDGDNTWHSNPTFREAYPGGPPGRENFENFSKSRTSPGRGRSLREKKNPVP